MFSLAQFDHAKVASTYLFQYMPESVDRVAILGRKGYRDPCPFPRFIPGLSSSWRSNTSKKNPRAKGISFVNVSSWPKADKQWYLGVLCRRCRLPILFAIDRSGGSGKAQAPSAGRLVLTCTLETCRHRADYTTAAVSRFQKNPVKPNETRTNGETKSRKRKS